MSNTKQTRAEKAHKKVMEKWIANVALAGGSIDKTCEKCGRLTDEWSVKTENGKSVFYCFDCADI